MTASPKHKKASPRLRKAAGKMVDELISIAVAKRKWDPEEGRQWDRALTALRKLAGLAELKPSPLA